MVKKKNNYDVTTTAKCLTDNAVGDKGMEAFTTFRTEDIEVSNDYMIPFHAICEAKVKLSQTEVEVDDPTCQGGSEPTPPTPGEPRIDGADNTSVNQGMDFDLLAGVKAYDGDGNEIPFTVNPTEIDKCDIGSQSFTYSAEGVTKVRTIEVTAIADPTISGLTPLEVEVGEEFDPLDGVSAVDGNGKSVEVTVEQPTIERLLLRGGAVDARSITMDSVTIPNFTHVSDEPYDGLVTVKFTNFMCKRTDASEYVQGSSDSEVGEITYSVDGYAVKNVSEPGDGIYLPIPSSLPGATMAAGVTDGIQRTYLWNSGDGSSAMDCKWDSLEIWTKTE